MEKTAKKSSPSGNKKEKNLHKKVLKSLLNQTKGMSGITSEMISKVFNELEEQGVHRTKTRVALLSLVQQIGDSLGQETAVSLTQSIKSLSRSVKKTRVHRGFNDGSLIVQLEGLPFSCTEKEIIDFFNGLDVSNDRIIFGKKFGLKPSGDAVVKFTCMEDVDKALKKNKELICGR